MGWQGRDLAHRRPSQRGELRPSSASPPRADARARLTVGQLKLVQRSFRAPAPSVLCARTPRSQADPAIAVCLNVLAGDAAGAEAGWQRNANHLKVALALETGPHVRPSARHPDLTQWVSRGRTTRVHQRSTADTCYSLSRRACRGATCRDTGRFGRHHLHLRRIRDWSSTSRTRLQLRGRKLPDGCRSRGRPARALASCVERLPRLLPVDAAGRLRTTPVVARMTRDLGSRPQRRPGPGCRPRKESWNCSR